VPFNNEQETDVWFQIPKEKGYRFLLGCSGGVWEIPRFGVKLENLIKDEKEGPKRETGGKNFCRCSGEWLKSHKRWNASSSALYTTRVRQTEARGTENQRSGRNATGMAEDKT